MENTADLGQLSWPPPRVPSPTLPTELGPVLAFSSSPLPARLPASWLFSIPRSEVKLLTLHLPEEVFPLPHKRVFAVGSGRISPSPGEQRPGLCARGRARSPRRSELPPLDPDHAGRGPPRPGLCVRAPGQPARPAENPVRHSAENSLRSPGENLMKMLCDHTAKLSIV